MAATSSVLIVITPLACVLDPDDRCGPNEVIYGDDHRCVCVEGSARVGSECTMCGEHEVAGAMGCECAPGYVRPSGGDECELAPNGLGAECDAATPCTDEAYGFCQTAAGGGGYCTSTDCTADSCTNGYACDETASPTVCLRPPTGLGKSCTSSADCAGTEATYCDTFRANACIVEGCTVSPNDCFPGWECCDLTAVGLPRQICIPPGACPT